MISVVIPAFNEEEFLPDCLKSLQNQNYTGHYEIIVVDNASSDGTAGVAAEFGARVVYCPTKGVIQARQAGANAATGDIIVQADADTIYPSNWLATIDQHFASHSKSAGLAGTYVYGQPPHWAKLEYSGRSLANRIGILLFRHPAFISGANFAFRREAFLMADGYGFDSLYPDQWGIAHRLSQVGPIAYNPKIKVSTSTRRVDIPFSQVMASLSRNVVRVIQHFFKNNFRITKPLAQKLPLIRTPARFLTLVSLVGFASIVAYGYLVPASQVFGEVFYAGQVSEKVVALTFDDGPNEPYTSEILDILDQYDVKATFFVIGQNAELYPDTVRREIAEGHVIGNHTYSHDTNHALTDDGQKDITLAQETIFNIAGVEPHLYRPPQGKKSPWELQFLKKVSLIEVTWSADANDEQIMAFLGKPTPELLAKDVVDEVKPGRIVQLQDGYGTNHGDDKSDKSVIVEALPLVIEELQRQGYRFVTVPELLEIPAYNRTYR